VHCTDTHRERPDSLYAQSGVDDPAAYQAFTESDVQGRREARLAGRPQPSSSSQPERDDGPVLDTVAVCLPTETINAHVATGKAERLGALPGATVLLGDRCWLADGARYVRIDDDDLDQQLRRDHQRLKPAAAVESAPRGDAPPGSQ
jgi:hypothetical protein